jgi:MoxR-like ATPase
MLNKSPQETAAWLDKILASPHNLPTMLWGPPGIGKSSLDQQAAERANLPFVQLELAVLPPQELMGLPYVKDGKSHYAAPGFWPSTPNGILVLEDLSHALPAVQAMGMSLLLEKRVGQNRLPKGWKVLATGNRVVDAAGAHRIPTATASRMVHITVKEDITVWRNWGLANGIHEDILGLLGLRPELLHRLDKDAPAWPSPRTWSMASHLHEMGLEVDAAVGEGAAAELQSYVDLKSSLPALEPILSGKGQKVPWPEELSLRWALVVGLAFKAADAKEVGHAFHYLKASATPEWWSLFLQDVTIRYRSTGRIGELAGLMNIDPEFDQFINGLLELVA